MRIQPDDLTGPEIAVLLQEHLNDMNAVSPPESKHALDLTTLKASDISFWTIWQQQQLAGCVALKQLNTRQGEIKSMRSATAFRGQGLGKLLLQHVITEAKNRGYQQLFLETGAMDYFAPARALYKDFGFEPCAPFASYKEDPNSVFMLLQL
ncbi:GNAT family N-acetyltransferase [Rheinheimera sp. MM224]|uniref:GNAT family N-acetyltransferase n=1 Tax=Rheinheimera sp. MM224 TaxID=3019969 RepID=UPI0021F8FBDE|nr:GNAT family N-acetyltransferase [Rheinheimera sp. MM224]CAI3795486.1 putative N-acetyltransferase YsnE [Rheinheimera sp. MM224]